ncbi:MAG: glycosyltransferase family 4 protein [Candidatus Berkelbacteria bacterium]
MNKPVLAILTESIRFDNQDALKYFSQIKPVHFYENAPYGDLKEEELVGAVKYENMADLEQKLLTLKPDIIQGAEPYASRKALKLCLVAKKVSKKLNIPLIFPMLENRPVNDRFGVVAGLFLKQILKKYAESASLIFYLNEGAKRNLLEVGTKPKKLVKILYGIWGIETDIFRPMSEIKNEQKILFMGRLDEAKGLPYVVEAWKSIEKDFPEVSIYFSGKGDLDYMINGSRMSRGFSKNSDLPTLINSSLFTITASITMKRWEEQIGMTNLQALSCGVPVITTLSGGIPEYVNPEVGILVPEKDSKAIAQAMRQLLTDEKMRQNMGQKGREYILKNFDAQKTIEKVEEILLKLV